MSRVDVARLRSRRALAWARANPGRLRAAAIALAGLALLSLFVGPLVATGGEARHLSAYADDPESAGDLDLFLVEVQSAAGDDTSPPRAVATSPYLLDSLEAPERHVLFVFGVEKAYTQGETEAILRFLAANGTLVLANDVGNANPLSQRFGVVFFDKTILDRQSYRESPKLVDVTVPFGGADYRVLMNAPSYATLLPGSTLRVLAESSVDSFLDLNDDGEIDVKDTPGPFPLVMEGTFEGRGRVIVLADATLFTNGMLSDDGLAVAGFRNAEFARALATSAVGADDVALVDESRHLPLAAARPGNAAVRTLVLATTTPVLRSVLGVGAVALVALAVAAKRGAEDWSVHTFDVGHALEAPESLAPTPERMRALAARAVCERYNIPFEYLEAAPVDEIARLTGDRELAAVAKGVERPADLRALFSKLTDPAQPSSVTIQPEEVRT